MNLLQKIEALGENGAAVALGCRRNRELDQGVLTVPCLGSLSREFLLLLDGLPFPVYLIHNEETCSGCPVTKGGELYRERLKELRSFQEGLDWPLFHQECGTGPRKVFPEKSCQRSGPEGFSAPSGRGEESALMALKAS